MKRIRINKTPPGFAPESIREAWIGIEIPLATEEELRRDPPSGLRTGTSNLGGYTVLRSSAIKALRSAGKTEAAKYWRSFPFGMYLEFKRSACTLIEE